MKTETGNKRQAGKKGKGEGREEKSTRERLEELYRQAEAIKVNGMKAFQKANESGELLSDGETTRLTQMVIKAIEVQLRILDDIGEGAPDEGSLPGPAALWEVLSELPETGPFFRRDKFRERLAAKLRQRMAAGE
jgi:hypothetical protein